MPKTKPYLFLLLSLILSLKLSAQSTIAGKIEDVDGKPLTSVSVTVLRLPDSTAVKNAITNDSGRFVIKDIPYGKYSLFISAVGFIKTRIALDLGPGKQTDNLDVVTLTRIEKTLEKVVVSSSKPLLEQKIDRLVVNVQNDITISSGTVIETLQRLPGVSVDAQKFTLSLNGKDGVLIMINGKVSHQPIDAILQMLSGMSAANIKKIELISNPPAKYDAAGNAGIINIVLKDSPEFGTNGSFTLTAGYGKRDKEGASFNLNHRTSKLNMFADFSFYRNHTHQYFENKHIVNLYGTTTSDSAASDRDPVTINVNSRVGLDYNVGKNTSLSAIVSGFSNKWHMNALNDVEIQSSTAPKSYIRIDNTETSLWQNLSGNVSLDHKIDSTQEIIFDVNYLYYHNDNPTNYRNIYQNGAGDNLYTNILRGQKNTPFNIWVGKADHNWDISRSIRLESGLKGSFSRLNNDVHVDSSAGGNWVPDKSLTTNARLNENILAAYSSVNISIDGKTKLNAGLRYEHTNTKLETATTPNALNRHYGNLFPSVFASRQLSKDNVIQASYGRRITRPSFYDLAPFVIFLDPTTLFYGNDSLKPSYASTFKLDYRWRNYILSLQYNHEDNAIASYQPSIAQGSNLQMLTSINLRYRNTYTIMLGLPTTVTTWWKMQVNLLGIRQQQATNGLKSNTVLSQNYFRINSTQSFQLPAGFTAELSGFYQSAKLQGVTRIKPIGTLDIGIQKKIQHNKGTLRFTMTDVLWTFIEREYVNMPENNLVINELYKYEPRIVKLSYSYSFGNSKLKGRRERETGSEDIKNRVR